MKQGFFATFFYLPLYNALVLLINLIPGRNAAVAVIVLTTIIRVILFPLSKKAIRTQLEMREIEPEVKKIKEQTKDKQEQARLMVELYRKHKVNPFASILLLIIQLPILIALYQVFQSGLPTVNVENLYSFVTAPESISMSFLGIDLTGRSLILALLAAITQYIQINLSLPKTQKKKDGTGTFQEDFAHSMNVQMRYGFPVLLFFVGYFSAVIAIYLTTSNILMTLQELFVKRKMVKEFEARKQIKA